MASIELLDEETLNVTLSDDIGLESNINEPESINVEQLPNDYTPSYTESDPVFVSSPAASIKEDDITNWNSKSDFDGDYESLTNKPTIPTVPTNLSSFTDDLGSSPTHTHSQYLTEHQDISGKVDKETGKGLSSNDFTDTYKNNVDSNTSARHSHSNKSVLDDISSSDVSNWDSKQEALVSGTNIKTINNTSLLGSGNITIQGGGGGTATDVQINGTSITSNDVANIVTEGTYDASTNKIATKSDIPTKTSDLTNDSGFITSYTETDPVFTSSVAHGITSTDITNWNNKSTFSGNYNDLTNKPTIPDELSDLSDDSTHRLVTDTEKTTWNAKSDFSGSYNDLTNKPTIPTKVSDLTNDSGFIDNTYHDSSKQNTLVSGTNIKTINNTSLLGSGDISFETIQEISGESSIRIKNLDAGIYKIYGETYGTDVYYNSNDSLSVCDQSYSYLIVTVYYDLYTVKNWVYIGNHSADFCYGYSWLSYGYCYNVTSAEAQEAITGILSNLTTTAKTNLVSAINELDSTKQDAITSTNKLDYSLIDNTPTIPTVPTTVSSFTNDAGYITGITSSDVTTALGYTPEKQTTLILDDFSFLDITSTSDSIFQDIKDAIDNEKSFKILYEDFMDNSKYYLDTENYEHITRYSSHRPESYSFCYMAGGLYTEVKYTINGTSITTTTTKYSKQDELVSGTNIKTINGNSILGSGNLTINASTEVNNLLVALGLDTDTYSTSTTYAVGDTVVYNNTVYECNTANTTGTWDSTKWDLVPIIVND